MKIFHTENGKEVVYVQMQDIMYLYNSTLPIPSFIVTKVLTGLSYVNDSNRFDFVRFDEEDEVSFFKNLEFIIDYDKYKDFTDEQLDKEIKKLAKKANKIIEQWNNMSVKKRKQNYNLLQEQENLDYMITFLFEIYQVKNNKRTMPFPEFVKI